MYLFFKVQRTKNHPSARVGGFIYYHDDRSAGQATGAAHLPWLTVAKFATARCQGQTSLSGMKTPNSLELKASCQIDCF